MNRRQVGTRDAARGASSAGRGRCDRTGRSGGPPGTSADRGLRVYASPWRSRAEGLWREGSRNGGKSADPPEASPLRIGIDASALAKKERTGVARYVLSLVEALGRVTDPGEDSFLLCYRLSRLRRVRWFHRVRRPHFSTRVFQEGFTPLLSRRLDLFHGPDARLPRMGDVPLVATVHDVFSLDSDAFSDASFRKRKVAAYADLARRARRLVFVSGYSRDRFLHHFPEAADRARAVPLGVDPALRAPDPATAASLRARMGVPAEYMLFLGQVAARKNCVRLLEAVARLPATAPPLILAGPRKHGHEEVMEAYHRLGLGPRAQFLGHVAEENLGALYAGASLVVLPSLDEGFGLPVVEAMACGAPVVCSRAGALPETAADAAVLVDPLDPEAIAAGMRSVLDDSDLRRSLVKRGHARAAALTWDATARATLAVWREASA